MLYDKDMFEKLTGVNVVKYVSDDIVMDAHIDEISGKILPSILEVKEFHDGKWFVFTDNCEAMYTAMNEVGYEPDFVNYETMVQAGVSPLYAQLKIQDRCNDVLQGKIPFVGTWEDATNNLQHKNVLIESFNQCPDNWIEYGAVITPIVKVNQLETRKITDRELHKLLSIHGKAVMRMAYIYFSICFSEKDE